MAQLHPIAAGDSERAVVFIHGVNGNWENAWTDEPSGFFWPEALGRKCGWGVFSVEYDVNTNWGRDTMPLTDRATNLLDLFLHDPLLKDKKLAIVAHSFGGLVAKQMVRKASDSQSQFGRFVDCLAGIVFIATPHSGAQLASFLHVLRFLIGSTVTVEDLRHHAPALRDLDQWYRNHVDELGLRSRIFFETRPMRVGFLGLGRVIVDPASANAGLPRTDPIPIDADHVSISKVASTEAHLFVSTANFLTEVFELPPHLARLPKQVAAICYRGTDSLEFLLVKTTGSRWTFPKGHIEKEDETESAENEAFEEAGVRGEIDPEPLTTYLHAKKEWKSNWKLEFAVRAYLFRVTRDGYEHEKDRDPTWFSPETAKKKLAEDRELIYAKEFDRVIDLAVARLTMAQHSEAVREVG